MHNSPLLQNLFVKLVREMLGNVASSLNRKTRADSLIEVTEQRPLIQRGALEKLTLRHAILRCRCSADRIPLFIDDLEPTGSTSRRIGVYGYMTKAGYPLRIDRLRRLALSADVAFQDCIERFLRAR